MLDAGASVLSMLITTPSKDAYRTCEEEIEGMLSTLALKRIQTTAGGQQTTGGKLVIPPPHRPSRSPTSPAASW
ncbi:MAG TPA: hypothetical protein VM120_11405 [Bryobacteraceae bacterium]|nr:hypothetical protein [Bryobacteraceae bacterium]